MATVVVAYTSSNIYTVPSDYVTFISLEAVGSGADGQTGTSSVGGHGGGAGAYAIATTDPGFTAGGSIGITIGAGNSGAATIGKLGSTIVVDATAASANSQNGGTGGSCTPSIGAFSGANGGG